MFTRDPERGRQKEGQLSCCLRILKFHFLIFFFPIIWNQQHNSFCEFQLKVTEPCSTSMYNIQGSEIDLSEKEVESSHLFNKVWCAHLRQAHEESFAMVQLQTSTKHVQSKLQNFNLTLKRLDFNSWFEKLKKFT